MAHIIVTGNELLPAGELPTDNKIVDSNSPMLASLISRDGGLTMNPGILPDDPQPIRDALQDNADVYLGWTCWAAG